MATDDSLLIASAELGPCPASSNMAMGRRFAPKRCVKGLRIHFTPDFSQSGTVISGGGSKILILMTPGI
jgi:hypothetical protein